MAKGDALLPSEMEAQRELAEAAGYVSPFPIVGPVPAIDDRCEACRWSLFQSMLGSSWCPNPKCSEHRIFLEVDDGEPVPAAQ